jgi:hypothetical protein
MYRFSVTCCDHIYYSVELRITESCEESERWFVWATSILKYCSEGPKKKPEISQLVSQQLVFKTKACHIQRGSTKRCTEKFVLIATYTNLKVWNTVPR